MANGTFQVFQRSDGKWAWRLLAENSYVIATDGGQGYNNRSDADSMGRRVLSGEYKVD